MSYEDEYKRCLESLNGTIGLTNSKIARLAQNITDSSNAIINSNKKLAKSQNFHSWTIIVLTTLIVLVGVAQASIMFIDTRPDIKWKWRNEPVDITPK